MKTIVLKKIHFDDLLILQNIVLQFYTQKMDLMRTTTYNNAFFDNLLSADIAHNISFRIRNKIENENRALTNFKIKIHEAIILLQCCNDYKTGHKEVNSVNKKFLNELHKQLINL